MEDQMGAELSPIVESMDYLKQADETKRIKI